MTFPGPAGILEGLWGDPGTGMPPVVISHPHPGHGGTMHNKVVHTTFRVLDRAGHPTLRFNFRGVGRSRGFYSGGNDEMRDIGAAATYARGRAGKTRLWGAGFSFGAWTGLQWALEDGEVERFIAMGVPVDNHPFDFLDRLPFRLAIIQGERDRYGSVAGVQALAGRLAPLGVVDVRIVKDADHFFTGKLEPLARAIREIL